MLVSKHLSWLKQTQRNTITLCGIFIFIDDRKHFHPLVFHVEFNDVIPLQIWYSSTGCKNKFKIRKHILSAICNNCNNVIYVCMCLNCHIILRPGRWIILYLMFPTIVLPRHTDNTFSFGSRRLLCLSRQPDFLSISYGFLN